MKFPMFFKSKARLKEDAARRRLVERKQVQARFQEAKSDAAAAKVGQFKLNPGLKAPGFKV